MLDVKSYALQSISLRATALFKSNSFQSFVAKLCSSMQFAACAVLVLELLIANTMEEDSCEAKGSFWKDVGMVTYLIFFIFRFFLIQSALLALYNDEGKAIMKYRSRLPSIKDAIQFEATSTDTINTCSSIYGWTIPGVSEQGQLAVKSILYVLTLLSPAFDLVFSLGTKTRFKQKIKDATANPKFKKYFIELAKASYAGINLASTVTMIIQFATNVAYDSVHEENYPHSSWLLGVFGSLAGVMGFSISLSQSDRLKTVLTKLQSSADSFYYPAANMLSIAECQWPTKFSVVGFKKQGYGLAIGASTLALVTATLDYFTHRPPNNKKEIIRVVEQFSAEKTISAKIKAVLINMLCVGYLQEQEDSVTPSAAISRLSEKSPLLAASNNHAANWPTHFEHLSDVQATINLGPEQLIAIFQNSNR